MRTFVTDRRTDEAGYIGPEERVQQDFLQVFPGSGIGKMEDNLTSADPLSYTTNGS